ncbi:MAG: hypothetical protein LQ350_006421 [Teloschistes chrysophthalmus]|nr:MAG: hypothetical protein LQ350_006421 [Niorma chrysophthalma]
MRLKPRIVLDGREAPSPSTLWTLGFSALLWIATYQYFRFASARDPTSYFFSEASGYERRYSLYREQQAYDFLRDNNASSVSFNKAQGEPFMCVGVATVARTSDQQYVRGTIGSLLQDITQLERQSIYLMPFIAHTNPHDHPINEEPWLTLADRVLEYDVNPEDLAMLQLFEEGHHYRNKSMYDYGYLLDKCHQTGASWIAMIEDDVLARDGWFPRAKRALQVLSDRQGSKPWLYMRIFYTEGLLGWNDEEWLRYFGYSLVCFVALSSVLLLSRSRFPRLLRSLSNTNIAVLGLVVLPSYIILYFMAGRVTVQPFHAGVHEMNRFGCCSQGFVFPRSIVPRLVERTKRAMDEDYYIDMLLERWADAEHLQRYVLVPSLLQHVGGKSSKGWGYDENAVTTWNFGFEDHPP